MSQAKDIYFQKLQPRFEAIGFTLKKSRNAFVKIENNIESVFSTAFDGRGGLSSLLQTRLTIECLDLRKAIRKSHGNKYSETLLINGGTSYTNNYLDTCLCNPKMYSLTPVELGKLSFEEKYPAAQIDRVANHVWENFQGFGVQAIAKYHSNQTIFEALKNYNFADSDKNDFHVFPLVSYLSLRFLSKQFNENADEAIANFLQLYEPFLELNPLDFELIKSIEAEF
jgi:hypothetical protein